MIAGEVPGEKVQDANRIIIVIWSCGPDNPRGAMLVAAPFVYALSARALDLEVEMHFTSSTVRWLFEGVARNAYTDEEETKTVLDFIREARAAGVKMFGCAMALGEHRHGESMIAEVEDVAGTATVIGAAVEAGTRALVF